MAKMSFIIYFQKRVQYLLLGHHAQQKGGLFYSPQDQKVFVSTNATFLENT